MYRLAQREIEKWFTRENRKPLVLRGARQVGKSTLVRISAEELGLELFEINLERYLFLNEIFATLDIKAIIDELEGICGEIKNPGKSLLFLDEIQATPHALQALRYFYEDKNELAVIAAGSLLEFTLAEHNFSMPVGRISYLHLYPMNFSEFLLASEPELYSWYDKIESNSSIPDSRHKNLLVKQREYMFVGGMPEAVSAWVNTGSMEDVQYIQKSIMDTYIDDFAKYARKNELARLQKIFRAIPRHIGQKVKYSRFSIEDKAAQIKGAIDLLEKARICTKVHHSDCSGLPLDAGTSEKTYKLLYIDIGLMNNLLGVNWVDIKNMDERSLINEGTLAEQFTGQELLSLTKVYYWLREGKGNNAEVDFVIAKEGKILPIEVKAGTGGSLKSLHQFVFAKKIKTALRFDLNKPSSQKVTAKVSDSSNIYHEVSFELISRPLYMAGKIFPE